MSQLKQHVGPKAIATAHLPLIDDNGNIQVGPEVVLQRRMVPRPIADNINVAVVQWLVKWINLPPDAATWENATFMQKVFPDFNPSGQGFSSEGGTVRIHYSECHSSVSKCLARIIFSYL